MTYYSPIPQMRQDCGTRLMRALLSKVGHDAVLLCKGAENWASGLFVGKRYAVSLELDNNSSGERVRALMQSLPDAEFEISGHIVADIAVEDRSAIKDGGYLLHLSILTIAEC